MEMRQVLASELDILMEKHENIVLLDADLSKPNGTASLHKKYPKRAINCGIQEQNMFSVAAGLSSIGLLPIITSFCPFVTRRIADQIMISGVYAYQNVIIIGTDPGVTAEYNGGTHMSFEDISILRAMPEIKIIEPCDIASLKSIVSQFADFKGVYYIRIPRKKVDMVYENIDIDLSKANVIKEGSDITIFASGIMVSEAIKASKTLENDNINAEVIEIFSVKPLDIDTIIKSLKKTKKAVTCENHNKYGALFSAIAEVSAEYCPCFVKSVSTNDRFGQVGKLAFLKEEYNLLEQDIVKACKEVIKK